jgi:hypothetical protein
MVSLIVYLVITVAVGLFLSFILLMTRSTKKRGDSAPYLTIFFCLVLTIGVPFLFCEVETSMYGKQLDAAVKQAYKDGPIEGPLQYYRVIYCFGNSAKVFAIGLERANWGGTDNPITAIWLTKKAGKWQYDSYSVLYCDRLSKDNLVLPPYR